MVSPVLGHPYMALCLFCLLHGLISLVNVLVNALAIFLVHLNGCRNLGPPGIELLLVHGSLLSGLLQEGLIGSAHGVKHFKVKPGIDLLLDPH